MVRPSRRSGHGRAAAPVRIVHLGLGNFFRAHQAVYTDRAPDADAWGIAAYGGRSGVTAEVLAAQDGLYHLVTRSAEADRVEMIGSISRTHAAADHDRWLSDMASPDVAVLTTTITEAGYPATESAPRRLVDGLQARRRADAGPLALVPCDNLPSNGRVLESVLREVAEAVDASLVAWMDEHISVVSTVVDRITPRPGDDLPEVVQAAAGLDDRCPVVAEPFSEWMLAGSFPAGRPDWEAAGASFVADVGPFERRKLWLLNGAHSLLAYAAPTRGHRTVAEAIHDPICSDWVHEWWDEAVAHLDLAAGDLHVYRTSLLERFANHRIEHRLAQIAADGSLKLPVRILPVLRAARSEGQMPTGAARALAGWVAHLRSDPSAVQDPRAVDLVDMASRDLAEAVPQAVAVLDPALAEDSDLVAVVADQAAELVS